MGCTSAGVEQDAGTMYPTLIQDTNGNQVAISYLPGTGPYAPTGQGWNPPNTSSRINQITDTRSTGGATYTFSYAATADTINHITGITNSIGTAEAYSIYVTIGQALNSPFTNASACGSTNTNCGTVGVLSFLTRTGPGLKTTFWYDGNGSGDLDQVDFPYGGHIRWAYRNFTYLGGRTVQEVAARYLLKDATASETTYTMYHDDAGDASRVVHYWTLIQYPTGAAKLTYFYCESSTTALWAVGLIFSHEDRASAWVPGQKNDLYSWAQDAGGNGYIAQVQTTLDQGTSNARVSLATKTLDSKGYGNVVTSQLYDYAPAGQSPLRLTTANSYLHDNPTVTAYDTAYIRNRVASTVVTPASGAPVTTVVNLYDQYRGNPQVDTTTLLQHDPNVGANTG